MNSDTCGALGNEIWLLFVTAESAKEIFWSHPHPPNPFCVHHIECGCWNLWENGSEWTLAITGPQSALVCRPANHASFAPAYETQKPPVFAGAQRGLTSQFTGAGAYQEAIPDYVSEGRQWRRLIKVELNSSSRGCPPHAARRKPDRWSCRREREESVERRKCCKSVCDDGRERHAWRHASGVTQAPSKGSPVCPAGWQTLKIADKHSANDRRRPSSKPSLLTTRLSKKPCGGFFFFLFFTPTTTTTLYHLAT